MALRAQTFICTCLEHYHNSPKIETIHMSINKCKDKQNVVCVYNRIIFGNKYGLIIDTWYNMDEPTHDV